MDSVDPILVASLLISVFGGCSAIAGLIAFSKRRSPYEGVLLGLILGPIGVILECRHPLMHRPPVDKQAWNSLRSLVEFQESGRGTRRAR